MRKIVPNILDLSQYLLTLASQPEDYRPDCCLYCQHTVIWRHGVYYRQPDRYGRGNESCNPAPILRFICKSCRKTTSTLPECIPPRRWYLWVTQQWILTRSLLGQSMRQLSRKGSMSRSTIGRWSTWLEESFGSHWSTLCGDHPDQGYHDEFSPFWLHWLKSKRLSHGMLLLNDSGLTVP